jgi:formylglycine-generating enzyme
MAEIEVTWNEYLAFYDATAGEGRSTDTEGTRTEADVDAISGPTPPYGQPDQNWGMGNRPAITMTYHAAETYCQWLRRLPEKHTACPPKLNGNMPHGVDLRLLISLKETQRFFTKRIFRKIFGKGSDLINQYVIYAENSQGKTEEPDVVEPNPYGLKNMLGNVMEYCSDWYAEDAYENLPMALLIRKGLLPAKNGW